MVSYMQVLDTFLHVSIACQILHTAVLPAFLAVCIHDFHANRTRIFITLKATVRVAVNTVGLSATEASLRRTSDCFMTASSHQHCNQKHTGCWLHDGT